MFFNAFAAIKAWEVEKKTCAEQILFPLPDMDQSYTPTPNRVEALMQELNASEARQSIKVMILIVELWTLK